MHIRALSVLATAAVLATASTSWGQDSQGEASDAGTASDSGPAFDAAPAFDAPLLSDAALVESGVAVEDGAQNVDDGDDSGGSDSSLLSFSDFDASSGPDDGLLAPPDPGVPGTVTDQGAGAGSDTPGDQPVTDNGQVTDKVSPTGDDASSGDGGPGDSAWGGAAPAAQEIQTPNDPYPPSIGCGDCSTGRTDASGALTLVVAAIAVAWRRRGRDSRPGHQGRVTR
jgi:MYXO-CTERM domain-containing protein